MDFEVIDSIEVFQGKIFDIRRNKVRYPDGRVATLDVLQHSGAVVMLPVDEEKNVWFVRQYRAAVGVCSWNCRLALWKRGNLLKIVPVVRSGKRSGWRR
jgi:ADP-ribose pyrophosphatase